jgi:sortase A
VSSAVHRRRTLGVCVSFATLIVGGGCSPADESTTIGDMPQSTATVAAAPAPDATISSVPAAPADATPFAPAATAMPADQGQTPAQPTLPAAVAPPAAAPAGPALRTPIPAPADENADEPVVELGTIEIPKLGVAATLYEGIRLPTFDRGPGHWPGTAMPGEFGNAVVGGHRTSKSKPFRHLDQLVPGDEVRFTTAAGTFVYRVTSTEIVDPYETRVVNQNPGFSATLFACHPVGSTKERIVVHLTLAVP